MGNTKLVGLLAIVGLVLYILSKYWWILLIIIALIVMIVLFIYLSSQSIPPSLNNDSSPNNLKSIDYQNNNDKKKQEEEALYKENQLKKHNEQLEKRRVLLEERNVQINVELEELNAIPVEFTESSILIEFLYIADFKKILSIARSWSFENIKLKITSNDGELLDLCIFYESINKSGFTEYCAEIVFSEKSFKESTLEKLDDKVSKFVLCVCRNKVNKETLEFYQSILTDLTTPDVTSNFSNNDYFSSLLLKSDYKNLFKKEVEVFHNDRMLLINYLLPSIDEYPKIKDYKYTLTSNTISEVKYSESFISQSYENTLYSICLRSLYELFSSDKNDKIDFVTFNGFVESVNKAIGKKERKCILSVQTTKEAFMEIELENVNPKLCFKNLKGVSAAKLIDIAPILPILSINRDDKRFVVSKDVNVDNETNLASMDWEDFEHLVRQLFEQEFSTNGGEVRVTQASRDGGVDAIVFDSDPLRGGKIVIQAKRYTKTVGVAAVRDLYGTLINEGANSGILITTSDYGSDSYAFAKGKPIKLLNGGHLLGLLEKHGHKARINIEEARNAFNR